MRRRERTCCICRSKADKRDLARIVCRDGVLLWDDAQASTGRGAYVHVNPECASRMAQPAKWEHVLRLSRGSLRTEQVSQVARTILEEAHRRVPAMPDEGRIFLNEKVR